jgi:hypothetical protein
VRSTARELHRVAALLKDGDYPIAVVALDLDHPILDAATAAAQALELAGKRGQLGLGSADPPNRSDSLPAAPLCLAAYANDSVAARRRLRPLWRRRDTALARGVDEPVVARAHASRGFSSRGI